MQRMTWSTVSFPHAHKTFKKDAMTFLICMFGRWTWKNHNKPYRNETGGHHIKKHNVDEFSTASTTIQINN